MVEKVVVENENKGPTLEEEAAELDKAKSNPAEPDLAGEEPAGERPEWLPKKFDTAEDMAKAYGELEKTQGKPKEGDEPKPEVEPADADKAIKDAGLDMDALSVEYADKGELTAKSLDALAKIGITGDMVDSYIAGQTAQADGIRNALLEPVGGQEAYDDMIAWATDNMEDGDIDAFNGILEGGDLNATKLAVGDLHNKFVAANGNEPARQLDGNPTNGSLAVYESTADLMKDMGNPEYAKNPAFRAKVEAKLSRSNIM